MAVRIGINGFGRIGRSVFRILADREDIQVVAVNDLFENEQLAYLLKYDTVMGVLHKDVSVDGDSMYVDGEEVVMIDETDPGKLPWKELDVDIVIESTGVFRNREPLEKHLSAGADAEWAHGVMVQGHLASLMIDLLLLLGRSFDRPGTCHPVHQQDDLLALGDVLRLIARAGAETSRLDSCLLKSCLVPFESKVP